MLGLQAHRGTGHTTLHELYTAYDMRKAHLMYVAPKTILNKGSVMWCAEYRSDVFMFT